MKRIGFLLLVLAGVLLQNFSLSAHEASCEKTYVSPDQLFIHRNGIYVQLGNQWFQTPQIQHDTQGIFVASIVQVDGWVCDKCGYSNYPWYRWCKNSDCVDYGPG